MSLDAYPHLQSFLCGWVAEPADAGGTDADSARAFANAAPAPERHLVMNEAESVLQGGEFPLAAVAEAANRNFADEAAARNWLQLVLAALRERHN